ncbi:MAG: prolipoprotein diacylglyceryl transferase family protein [Caldicoprobacterales bacterium]|jgi:phosphatidylglycerol:prolipoprotein diacylglycerol transferase
MNPIAFRIFGQPIYWYGILISIGVLLGIVLALRNAKYFDIDQDSIIDMAFACNSIGHCGCSFILCDF